ncbi:hypothetical protein B0T20DRAFT_112352 [Sordaria brevicollis]|uniref:Uncharacterized protein n=1 Tax=Sordaria brevicollis TaxID=83679 RepID=A0AAE0PJT4_SORBR|nr:hypothetical protein B0T20DRAFT_112352 [Sordaria brevicollis]
MLAGPRADICSGRFAKCFEAGDDPKPTRTPPALDVLAAKRLGQGMFRGGRRKRETRHISVLARLSLRRFHLLRTRAPDFIRSADYYAFVVAVVVVVVLFSPRLYVFIAKAGSWGIGSGREQDVKSQSAGIQGTMETFSSLLSILAPVDRPNRSQKHWPPLFWAPSDPFSAAHSTSSPRRRHRRIFLALRLFSFPGAGGGTLTAL